MLDVSKIEFGELDARNEVFQQNKANIQVFLRSFTTPPTISFEKVYSGAQFFISGQKGSGKTALIWYLKNQLEIAGATTEITLFKSDLTEVERQKIAKLEDTIVFSGQKEMSIEYDYKQNWLWYIIRSLINMMKKEDVIEGHDIFDDLKKLTGSGSVIKQSVFSGLQFGKIKTSITAILKTGPFSSTLKSEIEGAKVSTKSDLYEIIHTCEQMIKEVRVRHGKRYVLFFDELELFVSRDDQKERDLHLIKDLLYAVARINRNVQDNNGISVYASVRAEVLEELNRISPEIKRDVEDFGARVSWNANADDRHHPLIKIVESKIRNTEIEYGMSPTEDVWSKYFTKAPKGQDIRKFLMDISMLKPRNIIRILKLSQKLARNGEAITAKDFSDISTEFSTGVWTEIEEELLSGYNPEQVGAIKMILSGYTNRFSVVDLEHRFEKIGKSNVYIKKNFHTKSDAEKLIKILYRIGAVGNEFIIPGRSASNIRNRWVFRGFSEPLMHEKFVIHKSLLKSIQSLGS